jgi:NAD(P)-dependent dehydrogenase (short-subunit alcohol dehydrogenase family)
VNPLLKQRALITGASRGLGFCVARSFLAQGADLMLCARDATALGAAQQQLSNEFPSRRVFAQPADVSDPTQVRSLVKTSLDQLGGLDIAVCNAGIYGPKGATDAVDWSEWEKTIAINLFGVVHVCREVVPHFKKQRRGKIIILSGGGATKPMPFFSAYAASKAAVVRFGETLAEELRQFGVHVNCVAPGAMNTRFLEEALEAGPEKIGPTFYEQMQKQKKDGGIPPERAAALCAFLASAASDGITGKLISAVWDPWETVAKHCKELSESDIYTLRRIVPQDRGKNW